MKKITVVTLFLMCCMMLSSCKVETADLITIWHDKEEEVIKVIEEHLSKMDLETEIKFVRKDGLTDSLKLVGNNPSAAPDMFMFAHDKSGLFAEIGILEPINSYFNESELSDFLEPTIKASEYKGIMYQLPLYFETVLFMYNKDLMSEDEVPTTTEELYSYMQENTNIKDKKYGFVEQHSTAYYSSLWIQGFGGKFLSSDGEPIIDTKEVKDALEYHKKFLNYMPGEGEYSTINTLFTMGNAHSIIGGPWLVPTAKNNKINLGYAQMPIIDSRDTPLAPFLGVQGMYVLKHAANNSAKNSVIKQILNKLLDPKLSTNLALMSGCAPSQNSCYQNEEIKNDEMVLTMKKTAMNAVPMPNLPEMDVMFNVLGKLLEDVNMKDKDVNQACDEWQGKAQQLIKVMK